MLKSKCLGITVFQSRLKVRTFARTNSYEYGKQRQVQESPWAVQADSHQESQAEPVGLLPVKWRQRLRHVLDSRLDVLCANYCYNGK